jgi:hypothetical protein
MRTTLTLDDSAAAIVHRVMAERGLTFKEVVNDAIRMAYGGQPATAFRTPTFDMGFEPTVPWDKALRLAAELEDEDRT